MVLLGDVRPVLAYCRQRASSAEACIKSRLEDSPSSGSSRSMTQYQSQSSSSDTLEASDSTSCRLMSQRCRVCQTCSRSPSDRVRVQVTAKIVEDGLFVSLTRHDSCCTFCNPLHAASRIYREPTSALDVVLKKSLRIWVDMRRL